MKRALIWLQWVAVCAIGLTALTLLSAHAPGRVRLLGLFAVVFGGVCGWGIGFAGHKFSMTRNGISLLIAGLLIAAAEISLTLESYRLHVGALQTIYRDAGTEDFNGKRKPFVPDSLLKDHRENRERILEQKSQFTAYLAHRLKRIEWTASPWPVVFWIAELIVGTALGTAVFYRVSKPVDS